MARVVSVNHIAVAVDDLDKALEFWRDKLGLVLDHIEEVPSQNAEVAFLPIGGSEIELVRPTSDDTGLAKFIKQRGMGLHHLCMQVDDIEEMLKKLESTGVRLINNEAVELPGRKMAFIHPASTNGVLVELYELVK